MLFKRKQVLCTNCGFFCWHFSVGNGEGPTRITENPPYWRKRIQTTKDIGLSVEPETGEDVRVSCIRNQWVFAPHIKSSRDNYVNMDALTQTRKCPYYIRYEPGFGPEEHKELKREAETTKTIRKTMIIGAIIGASVAIIVQLLYVLFAPSP